jgi:hypothetical protein
MKEEKAPVRTLELDHPSLGLAYDLAVKSYDMILKRAEVWGSNLDKAITWGTGLNAGIVALIITLHKNGTPKFTCTFWDATILFLLSLIVGFVTNFLGNYTLTDPNNLDDKWTTLSEKEFQFYYLRNAGINFKENEKFIRHKSYYSIGITMALIFSAILFVIWGMDGL